MDGFKPNEWENQTNDTISTCKNSVDLFCIIFKLELEQDMSKQVDAKF